MKQVRVSALVYEMLQELSKKNKAKPNLLIESLIKREYT